VISKTFQAQHIDFDVYLTTLVRKPRNYRMTGSFNEQYTVMDVDEIDPGQICGTISALEVRD
jgi:hypothetical protein